MTPEHNRSIPAVLKNAIDWGARPYGKTSWPGKPAAMTGTSRRRHRHGDRAAASAAVLGKLGLHVMGGEAYIQFKPDLVDAQGDVTDDSVREVPQAYIDQFAAFAGRASQSAAKRRKPPA